MNLACTKAPGRGDTDLLLHRVAQMLMAEGQHVCGTVQINTDGPDARPCDMDVRVLPDGPVLRISQSLGAGARGCRLDPAALERAVGLVKNELSNRPDVLIINKFGKHEAEGGGFRGVIAEALEQGIPVLVGLNGLNSAAFHTYAGGMAVDLHPEQDCLLQWVNDCLKLQRSVA